MNKIIGKQFKTRKGRMQMSKVGTTVVASAFLNAAVLVGAAAFICPPLARSQAPAQSVFSTPEEAEQALIAAAKAKDVAALAKLFGPDYGQLLSSDDAQQANDLDHFAADADESVQLLKVDESKYVVTVGKHNWPTPIPIVQKDGQWLFDTKAGLNEVANRRIGENELSTIETCRAYAVAQWEYFTESDWDDDGVAEYAQKLRSTPGKHDGLYWEADEDHPPSPLGELVAVAAAKGSRPAREAPRNDAASGSNAEQSAPPRAAYYGYYFKILTRQGPSAPGGKYSYITNSKMIAGYALVAFPEKWSESGVMTFVINQQGRVYQKNLGPNTAKLAAAMTEYDPDPSWRLVSDNP